MSRRTKLIIGIVLLACGLGLIGWNMRDPESGLREPYKEERKIAMELVPPAVQATIKRETGDGRVEELEEKRRDGKTTYEVDIIRAGFAIELDISEDGKVLERESKKAKVKH